MGEATSPGDVETSGTVMGPASEAYYYHTFKYTCRGSWFQGTVSKLSVRTNCGLHYSGKQGLEGGHPLNPKLKVLGHIYFRSRSVVDSPPPKVNGLQLLCSGNVKTQ
jgi:hypothetical protein